MALTKAKKAEQVERLAKELEGSSSAIVGSFSKLTVSQDFELRKVVRTAGGHYRVVKNKLAALASKGTGVEGALQGLKGVSSVAYTSGDPVALAKALSTWVADNAQFTFKLGIVEGKVISIEEIKQLATMPGKEELYAKLLFLINSPAQRLITVLNAAGRDLAVVLGQGVEKEKFAGAATPVAEAPAPAAPVAAAPAVEKPVVEAAVAQAPATEVAATEVADAPTSQTEAAATEYPVEGKVVEEAPAAAESLPAPATSADSTVVDLPSAEATDTDGAPIGLSQTEAAATEDPVEGKIDEAPAAE
jgi:large subunit ribosomal protein L10